MAFPCSRKGHSNHLMKIVQEREQNPYAQCLKDESEIDLSDHSQLIWFGREEVRINKRLTPSPSPLLLLIRTWLLLLLLLFLLLLLLLLLCS